MHTLARRFRQKTPPSTVRTADKQICLRWWQHTSRFWCVIITFTPFNELRQNLRTIAVYARALHVCDPMRISSKQNTVPILQHAIQPNTKTTTPLTQRRALTKKIVNKSAKSVPYIAAWAWATNHFPSEHLSSLSPETFTSLTHKQPKLEQSLALYAAQERKHSISHEKHASYNKYARLHHTLAAAQIACGERNAERRTRLALAKSNRANTRTHTHAHRHADWCQCTNLN